MKRQNKHKESLSEKLMGRFEIPKDVVMDIPRITMMDNTEIRIENYKTVLEYEENKVQIACNKKYITVEGEALTITVITDDAVTVCGQIRALQFG